MFRHDFEFVDGHRTISATAGGQAPAESPRHQIQIKPRRPQVWLGLQMRSRAAQDSFSYAAKCDAMETYAREQGHLEISSETLYDAKAHFKA